MRHRRRRRRLERTSWNDSRNLLDIRIGVVLLIRVLDEDKGLIFAFNDNLAVLIRGQRTEETEQLLSREFRFSALSGCTDLGVLPLLPTGTI